MDRTDLISEARRAIRNAIFTNEPINAGPMLNLKGKEATEYVQALPLPSLKKKPRKKAETITPPEGEVDEA